MENEKKNQQFVTTGFVAAGFLAFFVASVVFETLGDMFGPVKALRSQELFKHGLPIAIGFITFVALFVNKTAQTIADECVTELSKVVWPSRRDTTAMTIVCCVMVVTAGIALGLYDFLCSQMIKIFVN
jgi:preprotein translocase subunit SecE